MSTWKEPSWRSSKPSSGSADRCASSRPRPRTPRARSRERAGLGLMLLLSPLLSIALSALSGQDICAGQNWWSGAGSNCRPSAFQGLYRPLRPKHERFLLPCSPASPLVSKHLDHSNRSAELCRGVPFRLWDSCGVVAGARSCGDSVGKLRANTYVPGPDSRRRRPPWRAMTHREMSRNPSQPADSVRPVLCGFLAAEHTKQPTLGADQCGILDLQADALISQCGSRNRLLSRPLVLRPQCWWGGSPGGWPGGIGVWRGAGRRRGDRSRRR